MGKTPWTIQVELGMEGVLTLNGLREATGLGISLTGGIGLNWYQTKIDQRDANGLYTDGYSGIDAGGTKPFNLSQLESLRDGEYETLADGFGRAGKFGIMPSLGVEIDYDLTNNLALGLGHRVTFSGTDLLDGQQWTNANALTGNNDRLHYTSLGLKYRFNQKNTPKKNRQPAIELIEPYGSGLSTRKALAPIEANISRVDNPFDVYLTVNGIEQRFNFSNNRLVGQVRLKAGENKIVITANNTAGTAKKTFFLTYETNVPESTEVIDFGTPEIIFTTPAYDNEKTTENSIKVRAKVRLVDDKKAIALLVNGQKERFDFDAGIGVVEAVVALREGTNTIAIKAKNRSGEQQVSRTLYRTLPIAFPTVNFTSPAYNNAKVDNRLATIKVSLQHIAQSSDLQLLVNGRNEPNFYFDYQNGGLKADIELREGRNEIEVIATNKRGEARDQRTIIYERPYTPTVRRPSVTINAPQYRESTTREKLVVLHATVANIFRKSDIRLSNNGRSIYDFDFNPTAKAIINFEVPLPPPPVVIIPNVDIYQPRRNARFEERKITVKANLSGVLNKRDIEFLVNREDCLDFRFNPNNGNFSATIDLQRGENTIMIKVNNPNGSDRKRITVFHERPYAPTIKLRTPNFANTDKKEIRLKATIQHIEHQRDIQLFLNNRVISNYRFRTDNLEATLRLREGKNRIEIIAANKYGETREVKNVDYYLPQPPSIRLNNITDNQTFKTARIEFAATVQNVTKKKDIKLFVNGILAENATLDGDYFTAPIRLKEGRNTLIFKASNDYGKEEVNLQINYLRARKAIITFVSHDDKTEVSESWVKVRATLKHVNDKRDLQLTLNNKTTNFDFSNGTLSSRVQLKKGRNIIRIVANSNDASVEEVLTLNYRPIVAKPIIRFTTNNGQKMQTQQMKERVTALVENVKNRRGLTLKINGNTFNDFDFDNGQLVASIPLKLGSNKISLIAKNEGGTIEKAIIITRVMGRPTISKGGKIGKNSKIGKKGAITKANY